ncbi:DUF6461 domain-containing protein [Kitasatospora sp. NPDC004240]
MRGLTDAEDAAGRFAWINGLEEDYIWPIVTVVSGVGRDEVVRRLRAAPGSGRPLTVRQSLDERDQPGREEDLIGVGTVGDLVFLVEGRGCTMAVPGVVRELSHGGRCFGVQIDVNGGDTVHYAVDGDLVVYEEHYGPIEPLRPGDPRWDAEWCRGLIDVDDPTEIWGVRIFGLMERVIGATVDPSWFARPLNTFTVPPASGYANTSAWDLP